MGQLDGLLAQFQMHDSHVGVEHALHLVVFAADDAKVRDFLELQDLREEVCLALDIGDREADHFYALHIAGQVARLARLAR